MQEKPQSLDLKMEKVLRFGVFVSDFRAAKERKKPDRVVFDCQERAYWVVHRPPVRTHAHTHTQIVIRLTLHTQDVASCR